MNYRKKQLAALTALVVAVSLISAFTTFGLLTTYPVTRFGPFFTSNLAFDSARGWQVGGQIRTYVTAAANTLKVGDVVYLSANNTVAKSATVADYNAVAGVVVGGTSTSSRTTPDSADLGTTAALPGKFVYILSNGRAWVKTADSVYVGNNVIIGAVAGTVKRKPTTLDSLNRLIGRAVFTIDSGKPLLINVNVR